MSFENQRKRLPVLVPYWVLKQLERNKLPLSTIFNLKEMLKISSMNDLAIMLSMNTVSKVNKVFFGEQSQEGLSQYWSGYFYNENYKLVQLLPLVVSETAPVTENFDDRLFASNNNVGDNIFKNPFEIKYTTNSFDVNDLMLIVIYPGYFGGPNTEEIQKQLVREYLKQSYAFVDYSTVAKDPVFAGYLRSVTAEPLSQ